MSENLRMSILLGVIDIVDGTAQHECSPEQFVDLARHRIGSGVRNFSGALAVVGRVGSLEKLRAVADFQSRLISLIEFLIDTEPPGWRVLAPFGVQRMKSIMSDDDLQALGAAGLFEPTPQAVAFWDRIAQQERSALNDENLKTGREGERLTMEHEAEKLIALGRPDLEPELVSFSDNTKGYDVKSWRLMPVQMPLHIEVKASQIKQALVHITKNEWRKACELNESWLMYVWDLSKRNHSEFTLDQIRPHIPQDQGVGDWQIVVIPLEVSPD